MPVIDYMKPLTVKLVTCLGQSPWLGYTLDYFLENTIFYALEKKVLMSVPTIEGKIPENPIFVPTPKYKDLWVFHPPKIPKIVIVPVPKISLKLLYHKSQNTSMELWVPIRLKTWILLINVKSEG